MEEKIPSADEVMSELMAFQYPTPAADLCDRLATRYSRKASQLGIQRAIDARKVFVGTDWKLSVVERPAPVLWG